ncbi:uncharacterized protein [Linepithema humile]|uniref:uncharacterized protein n=1 Tax=Linepithema humile TaxID=83485 RepID=UPI00351DCB35
MKYLGLTLDGFWGFEQHFAGITPKADRMAAALGRLLPNLGGPNNGVRRLYANVVQSVLLYGAPAHNSGRLPVEFLATLYAEIYRRTRDPDRHGSARLLPRAVARLKKDARQRAMEAWQASLIGSTAGRWTTQAIQPCLPEWAHRRGHGIGFHLTQVLTGHGCFGDYLCRIGREYTTECHHCAAGRDSAQHPLTKCEAWEKERRVLTAVVGEDLSLPALVRAMLEGEDKWRAASEFCDRVMSQKEEAERVRRGEAMGGRDDASSPQLPPSQSPHPQGGR